MPAKKLEIAFVRGTGWVELAASQYQHVGRIWYVYIYTHTHTHILTRLASTTAFVELYTDRYMCTHTHTYPMLTRV